MSENTPPDASASRSQQQRRKPTPSSSGAQTVPSTPKAKSTSTPLSTPGPPASNAVPNTPLLERKKKQFRSGYEVSPQALSFTPYTLEKKGRKREKPFLCEGESPLKRPRKVVGKVSDKRWNALAREAGVLGADGLLHDFQIECANHILKRDGDVCVVAPTGAGKSMLWCLPLLTSPFTISLVVTPYTTLGSQGESDLNARRLSSIFINAARNSDTDLEDVARGRYRVVFICVESLETPRFARVLHCARFRAALQAVYIDEAHLVKESLDWRPGYARLGQLRKAIGADIPLVAISATLPSSYRRALCTYAGLADTYRLINLGNFRSELSLAVRPLRYSGSFQDLAFTLPTGARQSDILPTLVYYDDTVKLTDMLWWYHRRLEEMSLPTTLAGIIHAGLSDIHQQRALEHFRDGHTLILLATEKIGAGVHLPHVKHVVQYLARHNLTLAKLDQRRGRGARSKGMTAMCHFLIEPELLDGDPNELSAAVDPGILALVRADGCYQDILDRWLENPPRQRPLTLIDATRACCSHCQPQLTANQEYRWITVDPAQQAGTSVYTLTPEDRDTVLTELRRLRLEAWKIEWHVKWRSFGPRTLIADENLEAVAKVATSITSLDDLRPLTRIPYWTDFAPWLLSAVQATVRKLGLGEDSGIQETGGLDGAVMNVDVIGPSPAVASPSASAPRRPNSRKKKPSNPRTNMHHAEILIEFPM